MRNVTIALVLVTMLGAVSAAAENALTAEDVCARYLAMREELAPTTVLRGDELKARLGELRGGEVELAGRVVGMACCAVEQEGEEARRLVTLELDDGATVCVSADRDVDELRIGELVCVIAEVPSSASTVNELRLRAWVCELDLPEHERVRKPVIPGTAEAGGEKREAGNDANGGEWGTAEAGDERREAPNDQGRTAENAPSSPASAARQAAPASSLQPPASAVRWVLEKNPRLTQGQAELIVKWVLHYSKEFRVNHRLVFAVIRWESDFHPECVSHAGAIGLMQLMPGTARYLGVDPWNVQQNIKGGVRYLAEQLADYRGRSNYEQCVLALAAYNAGPNAVKRAGGVPNIAETQRYVKKVTETFHHLWKSGFP
jgi:hypothetical protein